MGWWGPGYPGYGYWRRRRGRKWSEEGEEEPQLYPAGFEAAPPAPEYAPPPAPAWMYPPPQAAMPGPVSPEVELEMLRAQKQWLEAVKKMIEEQIRMIEERIKELEKETREKR